MVGVRVVGLCGEGFRFDVVVWAAGSFDWKGSILFSLWKVHLSLTKS